MVAIAASPPACPAVTLHLLSSRASHWSMRSEESPRAVAASRLGQAAYSRGRSQHPSTATE